MKKNANILDYVEKYKYKYGISFAMDGGKLVKTLSILTGIVWIYTFFWSLMIIFGTIVDLKSNMVFADGAKNSFISIIVCTVLMVIAAVFFAFKQKIIACAILVLSQPFMIFEFARSTKDVTGIGYISEFYWRHAIPSVLLIIFCTVLIIILVRAIIKTNKLYNMLEEGLYKQYGTRDGEKLNDNEWQEFLTQYNPYKQIF